MSWEFDHVSAEGTVLRGADSGAVQTIALVDWRAPESVAGDDELIDSLLEGSPSAARSVASERGVIEVSRGVSGEVVWIDHSASPRGDDVVAQVKLAAPAARQRGALMVISGLIAVGPDDDYDALPALAAAMIRLRVDQWLGLGIEAKALATQVGLEGSWDGESLWLEHASDAYDYLRDWAGENDMVLITGHRFGELPGLLELLEARA